MARAATGNVCRAAPGMMAGIARAVHHHQGAAADQQKNGREGNHKCPHTDLSRVPQLDKDPITPYVGFPRGKITRPLRR